MCMYKNSWVFKGCVCVLLYSKCIDLKPHRNKPDGLLIVNSKSTGYILNTILHCPL